MNAAVVAKTLSNAARASKAWGPSMPAWIKTLAENCDRLGSQGKAAKLLGYGEATVSQVIGNKYKGDLKKVQMAVQGAFMEGTVMCPILREISSEKCLGIQAKRQRATGHFQQRLERTCPTCPNFMSGAKND